MIAGRFQLTSNCCQNGSFGRNERFLEERSKRSRLFVLDLKKREKKSIGSQDMRPNLIASPPSQRLIANLFLLVFLILLFLGLGILDRLSLGFFPILKEVSAKYEVSFGLAKTP